MSQRLNFYSRYHRTKNQKDLDSLYNLIDGFDLDDVINDDLVERVSFFKQLHLEQKEKNRPRYPPEEQYVLSKNSLKKQKQTHYTNNSNKSGNDNIDERKVYSRKWSSLDKNGSTIFNSSLGRVQKIINNTSSYQQILQKMNTSRESKRSTNTTNKSKSGNYNGGNGKGQRDELQKKAKNDEILITNQQQDQQQIDRIKQQAQSPRFKKIIQEQKNQKHSIKHHETHETESASCSPLNLLLLQQQIQRQMNKFEEELASNRNQRLLIPNDMQNQLRKEKEKASNFDDQNLSQGMAQLINVDKLMNNSYEKKRSKDEANQKLSDNCKSEVLNRQIFSNSDQSSNQLANSRNKQDFQNIQPSTHNNFQEQPNINLQSESEDEELKGINNGFSLFNKRNTQSPEIKIPYKGKSSDTISKSIASNQSKNKQMIEESPFQKERKPFKKAMMDRRTQPKMASSTFVNEVVAVAQTVETVKNGFIKTNETFKAIVTVKPFQYVKSVQTMKSIERSDFKQPTNQNKNLTKQNIGKPNDSPQIPQTKQSGKIEKEQLRKPKQDYALEGSQGGVQTKSIVKKVNFKKVVKKEVASENNKQEGSSEGKKQKQTKNPQQKKQKLLLTSFFDQN